MSNLQLEENRVVQARSVSFADVDSSISIDFCHMNATDANDNEGDHRAIVEGDTYKLPEFERARRISNVWSMGQD